MHFIESLTNYLSKNNWLIDKPIASVNNLQYVYQILFIS